MTNNMKENNGKIWKWVAITMTGITISLIALTYSGLVTSNSATAKDLEDHKNAQVLSDGQTALAMQSIDGRLCNIENALKVNSGKCGK